MQITVETTQKVKGTKTDLLGNAVEFQYPSARITFYIDLANDEEAQGMNRSNYHRVATAIARRRYGSVYPLSIILRNDDLAILDAREA